MKILMEIRGIGYLAKDKDLMGLFESGQDVYMFCARFMMGEEEWDKLDDERKHDLRGDFKMAFLAYFYLRSAYSLSDQLEKTVEETQNIMDSLGKTFPEAIEFRDYLANYPSQHGGHLLTVFNEGIYSNEGDPKRDMRHGINTVIQGGTAVMLVYGFYNLMRQAWNKGWKFRSIGYVHDSSQSYFDINHLWEMNQFYYDNVTKFLYDRFRVNFAFDIMAGTDYYNVGKLKQISPDIIQLKGSATTINNVIQRLDRNRIKFSIANADELKDSLDSNGLLMTKIGDPITDFIENDGNEFIFKRDHTNYTIQLKKE